MKAISLFILAVLSLNLATAQSENPFENVSRLLQKSVDDGHCVGAAAGIIQAGEFAYWEGQGLADADAKKPFTPETRVRIASITKPMTAIAILQLVEKGELKLDQSVGEFVPALARGRKATITVRHLLQHSAGIRAYANGKERENYRHYPELSDALDIFVGDELLFTPGENFAYTTYGYVVLGMIIEKVSGQSYGDYLREHLWEPAGMDHTSIENREVSDPERAALYHQKKPGKIKAVEATDLSDRIPGGGVESTLSDLLRFGDAVLSGKLVSPASLALMTEDSGLKTEGSGYGLGWYLYGDNNVHGNIAGHTGAQLGCSAFLMLLPATRSAIVTVSNTSGALRQLSAGMNELIVASAKLAKSKE